MLFEIMLMMVFVGASFMTCNRPPQYTTEEEPAESGTYEEKTPLVGWDMV